MARKANKPMQSKESQRIPRAEMWLGHGLFQDLGLEDNLEMHLCLCRDLAMDIMFLSISSSPADSHLYNYHYFITDEVKKAITAADDLPVAVIINGPFQNLAHKEGVQSFLLRWRLPEIEQSLRKEAAQVSQLVSACLECKPHTLVIADDIAYQQTTLVNPNDLEQHLFILYREWIEEAHRRGVLTFFHSDGNLTGVLPGLITCGFDGLVGCELECQDVPALKQQYGKRLIFLTGILSELLEQGELTSNHRKDFLKLIRNLNYRGNFILGSSSGLSSAKHLANLKILYQWADEAIIQK